MIWGHFQDLAPRRQGQWPEVSSLFSREVPIARGHKRGRLRHPVCIFWKLITSQPLEGGLLLTKI